MNQYSCSPQTAEVLFNNLEVLKENIYRRRNRTKLPKRINIPSGALPLQAKALQGAARLHPFTNSMDSYQFRQLSNMHTQQHAVYHYQNSFLVASTFRFCVLHYEAQVYERGIITIRYSWILLELTQK